MTDKAREAELAAELEAELEAMRHAPYRGPDQDRGEVLAWSGVGIGLMGVGVVAASSICVPCMVAVAPLAAVTAPVLIGAGAIKRWRVRRREAKEAEAAATSAE
jgi:hypothetical protein